MFSFRVFLRKGSGCLETIVNPEKVRQAGGKNQFFTTFFLFWGGEGAAGVGSRNSKGTNREKRKAYPSPGSVYPLPQFLNKVSISISNTNQLTENFISKLAL